MSRLTWKNKREQACFRMGDIEYVGGPQAEKLASYEDKGEPNELVKPVRCKECRHVHSDDCPLAEYEFISPFD